MNEVDDLTRQAKTLEEIHEMLLNNEDYGHETDWKQKWIPLSVHEAHETYTVGQMVKRLMADKKQALETIEKLKDEDSKKCDTDY